MKDFLQNKYSKWYFAIIDNRKQNKFKGYGERHHIIPRSMGGSDELDNIVRLTAREHYLCHMLLIRMTTDNNLYKMKTAFIAMSNLHNRWHRRVTSRKFDHLKRGLVFTDEHRRKISEAAKRQMADPITYQRMLDGIKKRPPISDSTRQKMRQSHTGMKNPAFASYSFVGRKHSSESIEKMKVSHTGKTQVASQHVTCPHCGKTGASRGMGMHFDRCKHRFETH